MPAFRSSLVAGFSALFVAAATVLPAAAASESRGTLETSSGKHALVVELAETSAEREKGLMFRRSMAADHGMLFDFDESRPVTMWMKNTLIPLDMLFMDDAGVVTQVKRMAKPESLDLIPSGGPVRYVLELNGGAADRFGVKNGDRLRHPLIPAR
ncbi:MAG: DUF192 domain-containing protein [Methylobacterium mesophilicum]|nr:DUF192 domain-containing protein [Methylobacterium mesophilicum]